MSLSHSEAEAVRAKLVADPNTALIAESLELSLDAYVEEVMAVVMKGGPAPDAAAIAGKSGFTPAYRPKVSLDQVKVGEGVDVGKTDPKLKADIADQMRRNRNKKG